MFSKCGNPACPAPFGISCPGRFFLTNPARDVDSTYIVVRLGMELKPVQFFWVCEVCCRLMRCKPDGTPHWPATGGAEYKQPVRQPSQARSVARGSA